MNEWQIGLLYRHPPWGIDWVWRQGGAGIGPAVFVRQRQSTGSDTLDCLPVLPCSATYAVSLQMGVL